MEAISAQTPQPGVFVVNFEDISMARDIKRAISMLRGVTKVCTPRRKKLTGYEQARLDVQEGRICSYDSLDDFIKEIENG